MEALASGARCPGDRGKREGRSLWSWCPESSQHRLSLPWASLGLEGEEKIQWKGHRVRVLQLRNLVRF